MKKFKLLQTIQNAYERDNLVFQYFGVLIENNGTIDIKVWNMKEFSKEQLLEYFDKLYNYNLEKFEDKNIRILKWDYSNCVEDFTRLKK